MKVRIGASPYISAVPIALVGSLVEGKANFETIGDCGIMGLHPALVYVSSRVTHHTNRGILENGAFSINLPTSSMLQEVDFCGQVSGRDVDKSVLFSVFYGELDTAPLIDECPINLECRVVKEFVIQHRQIFVGEVVQTHVSAECLTEVEGKPVIVDARSLDPILYSLDNRYYRIGEAIGSGYREAGALLKRFGIGR